MQLKDDAIYKAIKEEKIHYVKERARARTLVTPLGEITIERRYYQNRKTNKYSALLDEVMDIPKHSRIEANAQAQILEKAAELPYSHAAQVTKDVTISRQTICNLVRKYRDIPEAYEMTVPYKDGTPVPDRLFIEVDEDHVAMQSGKNRQLRLAYIYEKKVAEGPTRRRLENLVFFSGFEDMESFWRKIDAYLAVTYGENNYPRITIIGDGATWIKYGVKIIPNAELATDMFHVSKYLRKISTKESILSALWQAIYGDDKKTFKRLVRGCLDENPSKEWKIKQARTYVTNNWDGIQLSVQDPAIHSSTEAHVSHVLSKCVSSRPMGWSDINVECIAKLRAYKLNGGSIKALTERKATSDTVKSPVLIDKQALILNVAKKMADEKIQASLYVNYDAEKACHIPGYETRKQYGFRDIMNAGFSKLM